MSFIPAMFYHYSVRPLARTPGVDNLALQPKFELPLTDYSGPTNANRQPLRFFEGAVNEGPQQKVIMGVQGVPNTGALNLSGLISSEDAEALSFRSSDG